MDDNDEVEKVAKTIFEPRVLAGNGIAGNIYGFEYRFLKVFNGGLPPPVTNPRKEFYNQPHLKAYKLTLPGFPDGRLNKTKPNIVYLWDIVKKHVYLYMAIPKHSLLYAATKLTLIPNPLTTIKQEAITEEARSKNKILY